MKGIPYKVDPDWMLALSVYSDLFTLPQVFHIKFLIPSWEAIKYYVINLAALYNMGQRWFLVNPYSCWSPLHCKKVWVTSTTFWSLSCIPFVCMTRKVQGMLTVSMCSWEASLFSISFQKAYKSAYQLRFVVSLILHICPWRSSLAAWLW